MPEYTIVWSDSDLRSIEFKYFADGGIFPIGTYTITAVSGWWYYDGDWGGDGVSAELSNMRTNTNAGEFDPPPPPPNNTTVTFDLLAPSQIWQRFTDYWAKYDNGCYDSPPTYVLTAGSEPFIPPTANFEADVLAGVSPLTVKFTNLSTGDPPLTYKWDFDNDGTVDSNDKNPTHVYTEPGIYSVKLTATSSVGDGIPTIFSDYIEVSRGPEVLDPWIFNGDFLIPITQDNNEFVINGGFESGTDAWVLTPSSGATILVDPEYKKSGDNGVLLGARISGPGTYLREYALLENFGGLTPPNEFPYECSPLLKYDYKISYYNGGDISENVSIEFYPVLNASWGPPHENVVGEWVHAEIFTGEPNFSVSTIYSACFSIDVRGDSPGSDRGIDVQVDNVSLIYSDPLPHSWGTSVDLDGPGDISIFRMARTASPGKFMMRFKGIKEGFVE